MDKVNTVELANPDRDITVTIFCEGEEHRLTTYANEYRNLMMLIYDRIFPEEFGECLGMGKCATCLIEIIDSKHTLTSFDRNEETTIAKSGISNKNVRLSCQILIDENINGLTLTVL